MGVVEAYTRISLRLLSNSVGHDDKPRSTRQIKTNRFDLHAFLKHSQVNTRPAGADDRLEHQRRSNQFGLVNLTA
jgi:hypothetical protein